jgi:hypothetical protein
MYKKAEASFWTGEASTSFGGEKRNCKSAQHMLVPLRLIILG